MKVNERRTVVGGGLIGHYVSPPTVERDRRAWITRLHSSADDAKLRCLVLVVGPATVAG